MTVTLELEPEAESRVTSKAISMGKSVEDFLVDIIDENLTDENLPKKPSERPFYETATDAEWIAALDSLGEFSDKIPLTWDDSRESIYGPREDAQL